MKGREEIIPYQKSGGEVEVRSSSITRPVYDKLFGKHGVLDGKLFHTDDKVTYTFIAEGEVVSLHFDRLRKTIFYKGHNISNLEITPLQQQHLKQFETELAKHDTTSLFVRPYSEALHSYFGTKTGNPGKS